MRAKVYNLKQMAAALQFMQEQNITEYDQLSAKAEDGYDWKTAPC